MRSADGWTRTWLLFGVIIAAAAALVLFQMWDGPSDEVIQIPADEAVSAPAAHIQASAVHSRLASADRNLATHSEPPHPRLAVNVDAVSEAINDLHAPSQAEVQNNVSDAAGSSGGNYDLTNLSDASEALVRRANKAADVADKARGAATK